MPRLHGPPRLVAADLALFHRIARRHSPALDRTLPRLSTAANYSLLWLAIAAVLATAGGRFGRRAALRGLVSISVTSTLAGGIVKRLVRRPRPSLQSVPVARRLAIQPLTTSFPSGHAASACAFAVGASSEVPALAPPLAALAAAVAYSRVYTGVHYPGDVVVGAAVGSSVAVLSRLAWPTVPRAAAGGPPTPVARGQEPSIHGAAGTEPSPSPVP